MDVAGPDILRRMLGVLLLAVQAATGPATETLFERVKPSVFTIEVHTGNEAAKSAQGSGYLVSDTGHIITNYHVVGTYVEEPDRYRIRARNHTGEYAVRLMRFDLVNDLAVLQADGVKAPSLPLASQSPARGAPIVALGNPQGLGLSLIEGIFNGFADKGVVDRMLLSMPLNAGMSGGPILNLGGEVIGTNVSVMYLSNSLSFGVPADKLAAIVAAPPLELGKAALREEIQRQLLVLETTTAQRAIASFADPARRETVRVGGAEARRPPPLYECWDDTEEFKDEGITKSKHGCNLQFTPSVESLGVVGYVDLLVEHFRSTRSRYGFYAYLEQHASGHHDVSATDPDNGVISAPRCREERIRAGELAWQVSTCLNAYVKHPTLFNADVVATSVSRSDEAAFVAAHLRGFRVESVLTAVRALLEGVRLRDAAGP
jgi:S1-C subfamily serine protease